MHENELFDSLIQGSEIGSKLALGGFLSRDGISDVAQELVSLTPNDHREQLVFVLEIEIDSPFAYARGFRNFIHGGLLQTKAGEELGSSQFDLFLFVFHYDQLTKWVF